MLKFLGAINIRSNSSRVADRDFASIPTSSSCIRPALMTMAYNSYAYKLGGSLEVNAPSYVTRQADEDFYQGLKAGEFCYVLNARQMGKSSLQARAKQRLEAEGVRCTIVDITAIGTTESTAVEWYAGLIDALVNGFGLVRQFDLDEWWERWPLLSPVQRFSKFLETVLLDLVPANMVIFVDEIDSVRSLPFDADDFFAVIRSVYNLRSTEPKYQRLTFALIGAATPVDLIRDMQRTPFNVGRAIDLAGFRLEETEPLQVGLGEAREVMSEILAWTGGQPFLTQKVCQLVAQRRGERPFARTGGVEEIVRSQIIENWEGKDDPVHLRTVRGRVLAGGEAQAGRLLGVYQAILTAANGIAADDSAEQMQLRLSGLVAQRDGRLQVFNRIYRSVFDQAWVTEELAKLRPAYYGAAIADWLRSGQVDESFLLRGKALQSAREWAAGKSLAEDDRRFLDASQELDKRDIQKKLDAEAEANQILTSAQRKANRRNAISLASAVAAIGIAAIAVPSSIKASIDRKQAEEEVKTAQQQKSKLETDKTELDKKLKTIQQTEKEAQQQAVLAQNKVKQAQQNLTAARQKETAANQQMQVAQAEAQAAQQKEQQATQQAQVAQGQAAAADGKIQQANQQLAIANQKIATADQRLETAQVEATEAKQQAEAATQVAQDAEQKTKLANRTLQAVGIQVTAAKAQAEGLAGRQLLGLVQGIRAVGRYRQFSAQFQGGDSALQPEIIEAKLQTQAVLTSIYGIQERNILKANQGNVWSVNFSPDGQTIVSGGTDSTVKLWNRDGSERATLKANQGVLNSVNISPDGQIIVSGGENGTVKLWNLDGSERATFNTNQSSVLSVNFSPDGQTIVSGGDDGTVKLWNLDGSARATLKANQGGIYSVNFSPDGQTIVSGGVGGTVKLWNRDGSARATLKANQGRVYSVNFSPDGKTIVSGGADGTVKLWNLDGSELATFNTNQSSVYSVNFSSDGQTIISGSADGTVRLWNRDGSERTMLNANQGLVLSVNFSPDEQMIVSGGADGTVKLWNLDSSERATLNTNQGSVLSMNISPDGQTILSGGDDGTVKLWNLDGSERATFNTNQGLVLSVNFSPDGQTILSGGDDGTVKLWNLDGIERATFNTNQGRVRSVNISPDGQTIVSGGDDGTVKLWNLDGIERATFNTNQGLVRSVNISPDGQTIVSGAVGGTVKLWNLDGIERATFNTNQSSVLSVNFSPDGKTIVSGGVGGTVKLWNLDGSEQATLNPNQGSVLSVNFSPDGKTILSGGADGTVNLVAWDMAQLLKLSCDWASDYLRTNPDVSDDDRAICGIPPKSKNN